MNYISLFFFLEKQKASVLQYSSEQSWSYAEIAFHPSGLSILIQSKNHQTKTEMIGRRVTNILKPSSSLATCNPVFLDCLFCCCLIPYSIVSLYFESAVISCIFTEMFEQTSLKVSGLLKP